MGFDLILWRAKQSSRRSRGFVYLVLAEGCDSKLPVHPARESMTRAADLAGVACEGWMQDWPIEVADAKRLTEFLRLLEAHRGDWQLTYWFLDLALESARQRADLEQRSTVLLDTIVLAVSATRASSLMQRLEYWACPGEPPEHSFEVSPIVRQALLKLAH